VVDTWWQTETGMVMCAPLPGITELKPGSATRAFPGIALEIRTREGEPVPVGGGLLAITRPWPAMLRGIWGDEQRFRETYWSRWEEGVYFPADGARRDADGDFWVLGRVDDVLNVSGHRIGTAEVESALVLHEQVAEAAVVGFPHDIKGEGIYAFVTLMHGVEGDLDGIKQALIDLVRSEIGPFAKPDALQWAPGLPKTRSGKIMRRILRKIAANDLDNLGDVTTLAEPAVVEDLIENRLN